MHAKCDQRKDFYTEIQKSLDFGLLRDTSLHGRPQDLMLSIRPSFFDFSCNFRGNPEIFASSTFFCSFFLNFQHIMKISKSVDEKIFRHSLGIFRSSFVFSSLNSIVLITFVGNLNFLSRHRKVFRGIFWRLSRILSKRKISLA